MIIRINQLLKSLIQVKERLLMVIVSLWKGLKKIKDRLQFFCWVHLDPICQNIHPSIHFLHSQFLRLRNLQISSRRVFLKLSLSTLGKGPNFGLSFKATRGWTLNTIPSWPHYLHFIKNLILVCGRDNFYLKGNYVNCFERNSYLNKPFNVVFREFTV